MRLHRFLEQVLAFLSANFQAGRQGGEPVNKLVVHQRFAHFQRVGHAGTIDLGIDIAHQIGLGVQVLNQGQRVVGSRLAGVVTEYFLRVIAGQFGLEARTEQCSPHGVAKNRDRMEIGFHRCTGHTFKRGLGTQHARRPVGLGIETTEQAKHGAAYGGRQRGTHALLHQVQAIAPITTQRLVTSVAG